MLTRIFSYLELVSVAAAAAFIFGAVDKGSGLMLLMAVLSVIYGVSFIVIQYIMMDNQSADQEPKQ